MEAKLIDEYSASNFYLSNRQTDLFVKEFKPEHLGKLFYVRIYTFHKHYPYSVRLYLRIKYHIKLYQL